MTRHLARLSLHPATPGSAIEHLTTELEPMPDNKWVLTFHLSGNLESLLIPPPAPPSHADGLWRHTCLEAFMMSGAGPEYYEFNFSPSGAWAAYRFRAYRDGGAWRPPHPPDITCQAQADGLRLGVRLTGPALPGPIRLGLSAVIEDQAGNLTYWALRHPPGRPDFHHTDAFALECPPP